MKTQNKHTPGPWTAKFIEIGVFQVSAKTKDGESYAPYGTNGNADAALIAAAPELLSALESCRELLKVISNKLGHVTHGTECETTATREIVRSAIAKARGES